MSSAAGVRWSARRGTRRTPTCWCAWHAAGRNVAEIAGNQRILITVLAPAGSLPPLPGTSELFEVAIQSRPDRRRLGLDVAVEQLGATIRALEAAGATIEHIYDY